MTIKVTAFHPAHFGAIRLHWRFEEVLERATPEYLGALAAESAITIWCDGVPVVCGGVVGACEVWGVFDAERAPRHKVGIVRAIKRYLATFPYLYINCERPIDCKLPNNLLGFTERRGGCARSGKLHYHLEKVA